MVGFKDFEEHPQFAQRYSKKPKIYQDKFLLPESITTGSQFSQSCIS